MSDTTLYVHVDAVIVDESTVAAAFTEWDRRYREDPEKFWSEATRLLKNTPESYGEACAPYFLKLLREKERAVEESAALSVFPPPEPAR